jgi:acyl-CoA thioester hydrolase
MADFKFYIPVEIRYSDLDPQWHVNNTRYLVYMEQARLEYLTHLGLFDGQSFLDLKMIIADVHVSYLAPIKLGQKVRVGTRAARLGNKSITFEYRIEDSDNGDLLATGEVVGVTFDYHSQQPIPIPADWRQKISTFEGVDFG